METAGRVAGNDGESAALLQALTHVTTAHKELAALYSLVELD